MADVGSTSLLEALPPELFNNILGYIFDPTESITSPTEMTFHGYRFDTSILRVNKTIHRVARSYLHLVLPWIRLNVNWHAFLIDPHWLGIPYIAIDRADPPKVVPYPYIYGVKHRAVKQDAPAGRIAAHIKFAPPVTPGQLEMRTLCFASSAYPPMSLLVLEADFCRFMQVLRINDLAYTKRSRLSPSITGGEQTTIQVQIRPGQERKRYLHLLNRFMIYIGPYCQFTTIYERSGQHSQTGAAQVDVVTHHLSHPLQQQIYLSKTFTKDEGVSIVMFLKRKGDLYLQLQQRDHAFMCYTYATAFEAYWQNHDAPIPSPQAIVFWSFTNDIYNAFGAALSINMCIAYATSNFHPPVLEVRHRSAFHYSQELLHISGGMSPERYIELRYVCIVCHMHSIERFDTQDGIHQLSNVLRIMVQDWEAIHPSGCPHETTTMGKVYAAAKSLVSLLYVPGVQIKHFKQIAAQQHLVRQRLYAMRAIMRGADIPPLVWAVRENRFPEQLKVMTKSFLQDVVMRNREAILAQPQGEEALTRAKDMASGVHCPAFDEWNGEYGERRVSF